MEIGIAFVDDLLEDGIRRAEEDLVRAVFEIPLDYFVEQDDS